MNLAKNQIELSDEQKKAVELAKNSVQKKENFIIRGPAGTGKTTLIRALLDELENFGVVAPTGKAALVLRNKGVKGQTIHRVCYEQVNDNPVEFRRRLNIDFKGLIIDEASMVSEDILFDLYELRVPLIFIGDHYQLEPVGKDPGLLKKCDFELTKVYRTAETSPILGLATHTRNNFNRSIQSYLLSHLGEHLSVGNRKKFDWTVCHKFDQVICGKNITRIALNDKLRVDPSQVLPSPGDKMICLRNDYSRGMVNGELFTVGPKGIVDGDESSNFEPQLELIPLDGGLPVIVPFWSEFFFKRDTLPRFKPSCAVWLDFGNVITCHKAQGSEWQNVLVIDQAFGNPPNRWRYTAITRAVEKLHWIL